MDLAMRPVDSGDTSCTRQTSVSQGEVWMPNSVPDDSVGATGATGGPGRWWEVGWER